MAKLILKSGNRRLLGNDLAVFYLNLVIKITFITQTFAQNLKLIFNSKPPSEQVFTQTKGNP
jgi:hypothetical protein